MTTRRIHSEDAAAAAELVRLVRERPNDLVDPFPPCKEMEVLVDMGSRGKDEACHAHIALDGDTVVGYGALDYSPELRRAQLVGPVIHPAHRRKGHGRELLNLLLDQARAARQKHVRSTVGSLNAAAKELLKQLRFRPKDRHTCLRLAEPPKFPDITIKDVTLRRVEADDHDVYFDFTRKFVARLPKQTRSLLKSDEYAAILAFKDGKPVGSVEVDMRWSEFASVENLDAPPSLLHKGLGNALLSEAVRAAFEHDGIKGVDLVMSGTDRARVESMTKHGFEVRHELEGLELKI